MTSQLSCLKPFVSSHHSVKGSGNVLVNKMCDFKMHFDNVRPNTFETIIWLQENASCDQFKDYCESALCSEYFVPAANYVVTGDTIKNEEEVFFATIVLVQQYCALKTIQIEIHHHNLDIFSALFIADRQMNVQREIDIFLVSGGLNWDFQAEEYN